MRDERGLAAIFLGLMIVVLLGFGAYSLDVSRIYNEHSELRNGADAAALAIARDCAKGACAGFYDAYGEAEPYADSNVGDRAAWVEKVSIDFTSQTVRVKLATEDTAGDNTLQMVLAPVLDYDGLTVRAGSTVAWGPLAGGKMLPLVFSKCEWDNFGEPGFVEDSPEGFLHHESSIASGFAGYESRYVRIYFHGTSTCHSGPSGSDLPGGFGWLEGSNGQCAAQVKVKQWHEADTGASPTTECDPPDLEKVVGTVQALPYFDATTGNGTDGSYHVLGVGALYVTGYNFGGSFKHNSTITGKAVCTGSLRCIEGYMIGDYVFSGDVDPGAPNLGTTAIELRS